MRAATTLAALVHRLAPLPVALLDETGEGGIGELGKADAGLCEGVLSDQHGPPRRPYELIKRLLEGVPAITAAF